MSFLAYMSRRPSGALAKLVMLFAGALLPVLLVPASATAMWVHWGEESASSYAGFTQHVKLGSTGHDTFWASQFFFTDDRSSGGYIGVQNDGYAFDHGWGQIAIFSLWNAVRATPADGAVCGAFDGEGEGLSCRTRMQFAPGDEYRVRVERTRATVRWTEFSASVVNLSTERTYPLGTIRVRGQELLQAPSNFIEYFGANREQCASRPAASAKFAPPVVQTATGPASKTLRHQGSAAPACTQEKVLFSARVAVVRTGS